MTHQRSVGRLVQPIESTGFNAFCRSFGLQGNSTDGMFAQSSATPGPFPNPVRNSADIFNPLRLKSCLNQLNKLIELSV
jgi:hypothetical protein